MVGKLVASAAYATVYLFTAELFPTVIRSTTMSVSAFFAGVGGILAPYIVILVSISVYNIPRLVLFFTALLVVLIVI